MLEVFSRPIIERLFSLSITFKFISCWHKDEAFGLQPFTNWIWFTNSL